ncbi:MAG TPA: polysaccharide deacetylase family protein [Blastocatellia bacterium]|nr:polysaccharide deacetylase family protein [Blastocatellia bacterium]HMV84445.1 polysaccharide deacetylase family protein [Blastocatellia bacterium]HMX29218.1 polysaccharide deacetylase family protein [Blastocatellia bacterium]HMY74416.1 polysaccharide deacetylase family protein [Blastocatellia bacterium]HMZ21248.1 polysaccharide deacetylase family protein [Blastocatellia bacterium]
MNSRIRLLLLAVLLAGPFLQLKTAASQTSAPVYVTLWFDTEDYVLPQSDDAAKRLAEMLTRLGVKATFKVVGEKARVLEQRGRKDVIAALKKHEIGYHSNLHSGQPTPAVYLQHAGWEDGSAEFYRREVQGVRDIERIFGVTPVCYGQPGSSWGPQSYPALKKMGVSMYLDEANQVGINEQPFYYGGMLNVFKMRSNVVRLDLGKPDNLAEAQKQFQQAAETLRKRGGGTISIYYHPCEFVHREFWDGVNFRRGANPPRSEWKLPPMQTAEEIERNFRDFEQYVQFIQKQSGVRFVHCADLMKLYEDRALTFNFTQKEIVAIAEAVRKEIGFQQINNFTLSAADSFGLLTEAYLSQLDGKRSPLKLKPLYGPARTFSPSVGGSKPETVRLVEFSETVRDVARFIQTHGRVPDEVWIGAQSISPQDYLATLGALIEAEARLAAMSGQINANATLSVAPIRKGVFTADAHVAEDSPKLWGWVIFPEGFHAPKIMELARLQAWTLKPAVLSR